LPDVPTVAESGYPGFRAATWFGVAAPAAIPEEAAGRLGQALNKAILQPDFRSQFQKLGLVVQAPRSQRDIDAYVQEDRERWGQVIEQNRIALD